MRVPNSDHEARPWVIGRIAPDFRLLDVWEPPIEGHRDEFESFLEALASFDPSNMESRVVRGLVWARMRLGALFGWDAPKERPIPGFAERTLSARLPEHLRGSAAKPGLSRAMRQAGGGFTPLYRTADEWAAETSNETVHGVLQLTWVEHPGRRYRPRLAVYVKPRGRWGELYMALIQPFRHLIVYPALMRQIRRAWSARAVSAA